MEAKATLPALISQEKVGLELNIALTKHQLTFQMLHDVASSLVQNEDHIPDMEKVVAIGKRMIKIINDTTDSGKDSYYRNYKVWMEKGKAMVKEIESVIIPIEAKKTTLCKEALRKKKEECAEVDKKNAILQLISNETMAFAAMIAKCLTIKALSAIESLINLEKSPSRKNKYGDYHAEAIANFDKILIPLIKKQKKDILEREKYEKELQKCDNPIQNEKLSEAIDEIDNRIRQNQIEVQQMALNQEVKTVMATQVYLDVDITRSDVTSEIANVEDALKKSRHLLKIELKTAEANKIGRELRDSGQFGDEDELVIDGVKYILKRKYTIDENVQ